MNFNMHVDFFVIPISYDMLYFNVCINSNHIVPNESVTCILTCVNCNHIVHNDLYFNLCVNGNHNDMYFIFNVHVNCNHIVHNDIVF